MRFHIILKMTLIGGMWFITFQKPIQFTSFREKANFIAPNNAANL